MVELTFQKDLKFFQVYDGIFEPDTAVLTYCGRDSPPVTIWSVSSALFVHFITDVTGSGLGFEARFVHMLGMLFSVMLSPSPVRF